MGRVEERPRREASWGRRIRGREESCIKEEQRSRREASWGRKNKGREERRDREAGIEVKRKGRMGR